MTKRKTSTAAAAAKATSDAKVGAAKAVGVNISAGELAAARKEGAKQAEKDAGKDSYRYATDGNLLGDPEDAPRQFTGYDDIQQFAGVLGLGADEFEAAIAEDAPSPIAEEKIYGLLALERNGQNRTPYVKAAMKRLGLKVNELPPGSVGYTNDVTNLSSLED